MDRLRALFVLSLVCSSYAQTNCPHDDSDLQDWNSPSAWNNGKVPEENEHAVLTGKVLLNAQPPTLHHLTVSAGAKLVFDPDTEVHLRVHAIYVEGELHIGSETCLFSGKARVTFIGEVDEDKLLLVKGGGTFEVHGERKLPWTKLAATAPGLPDTPDILESLDDLSFCNDDCNKGLLVYDITTEGKLVRAFRFDFTVTWAEMEDRILEFLQFLKDVPDGNILGIGLKKIFLGSKYDVTPVFEGIEAVALTGSQQTQLRNHNQGSAYALLTVKGSPETTAEVFEQDIGERHSQTAKLFTNNRAFVLESLVFKDGMGCMNKVNFHVYGEDVYRPTLTLLDNVDSWKEGDRLVLASTDYDHKQSEEVTILSKPSSNQVQLKEPLVYDHFGSIYKGVDMRGEVGLLTRNVRFDSQEASTSEYYGGHIKVLKGFKSVHIEGAELMDLGQQEKLGAYSIHFHMCGDVDGDLATRPWIRENSIHHTNSRCVTIHNTMGVLVERNVCYKSTGHSYFLEDGSEQRNIFDGNLGLGSETPPKGLGLIPTDSCPTTFWVTNPKNYYRNNVAAGSDCRGFWYNYPDKPLIDEAHMGHMEHKEWMKEFEARFTAIYEYDNNVAHSNKNAGLFIDNIIKPNGKSEGYNKYRPMKDPIKNDCMTNPKQCQDECVYLKRFTGYKNAVQNAWIRGGCIYLVDSSMSDSLSSVIFMRDNSAYQYLERSIVLGDSANLGRPESFLPEDGALQRSFPFGARLNAITRMHVGVEFRNGPNYIKDVWFDDFKDTADYYKMGAIGFEAGRDGAFSPRNRVTNAVFAFDDPAEGNRVFNYASDDENFQDTDGDKIQMFQDSDESVTDGSCSDPTVVTTVVRPTDFNMLPTCQLRDNWNMAWCCNDFGQLRVNSLDKDDQDDSIVTIVRDDDIDSSMDSDINKMAQFPVALGGEYSYTLFFNGELPSGIRINALGISSSRYVRIGICLPPNAEFELKKFNPMINKMSKFTEVTDLKDIDIDTVGDKYFFHASTGYLAVNMRHNKDFLPEEYFESPRNKNAALLIKITSGDLTKTRCVENVRKELGDMSPKEMISKRSIMSVLKRIRKRLNERKLNEKKSVNTSNIKDTRDLPADSKTTPMMAKQFTCNQCEANFEKMSQLHRHRRWTNHRETYSCTRCTKTFTRRENLQAHMTRHQMGYECTQCNQAFATQRLLELHQQRHGQRGAGQPFHMNDPKSYYTIKRQEKKRILKFGTSRNHYTVTFKEFEVTDLPSITRTLHRLFDSILQTIGEEMKEHDLVKLTIETNSLDFPIALPILQLKDLTTELLLKEIERVLQSHEEFVLDGSLELDVLHVSIPEGSGRKRCNYIDLERMLKDKRSFVRIQNRDELCCARAIVTAKARIDKHSMWDTIRQGRCIQQELAEKLHEKAKVSKGPCGIEELKRFQAVLPEYQITVFSKDYFNGIIYEGPDAEKKIYLYHHDDHYDVITTVTGFLTRNYYCNKCKKGYSNKETHVCNNPCILCKKIHEPCEDNWINCSQCGRNFRGKECFQLHLEQTKKINSTCKWYYKCKDCGHTVNMEKRKTNHVCGEMYCPSCKRYCDTDHQCYMTPIVIEDPPEIQTYIFFDFECTQDDLVECKMGYQPDTDGRCAHCKASTCGAKEHRPNLCVVHKVCTVCMEDEVTEESTCGKCGQNQLVFSGPNANNDFCNWLFSGNNNNSTVICHNFKGYDSIPVLQYLFRRGIQPKIIPNGAKNMSVTISNCSIRMIDSLNFLPTALAKLPKMFGFEELHKGYFPHLFNTKENQNIRLETLPDINYYNPNGMKSEDRETFVKWYDKHRNEPFEVQEELLKYCITDVDILRKACLTFRQLFMDTLDGTPIDPFQESITIASACNLVFRSKFLRWNTIGLIPAQGYQPEHKHSIKAMKWIKHISAKKDSRIQHAQNGGEKQIGPYRVDGYDNGTVYEFHGCYWHGCPRCYSRETINTVNNMFMNDLHQRTLEKKTYLEAEGYSYVEKWECDFDKEIEQDPTLRAYVNSLEMIPALEPRDAFYGGRTEAFTLYKQTGEDNINYYDVTSLYPFVNKTGKVPKGHPLIITENFGDINEYEGLVKCKVLPPKNLYIPVLPTKINNKLMFPLCRTCTETYQQETCNHTEKDRAITGTWVTDELKKALEKGYSILTIYEVWHFEEVEQYDPGRKSGGLFTDYINTFLKMKQEASGWPEWCQSEEAKQQYIKNYEEKEGIQLDYNKIEKNPGIRSLAKLMLNSFWGKFGQRNNMQQTTYITEQKKYFDMLTSDKIEVTGIQFVNDEMVELRWKYKEEFIETQKKTNVVIAAYTTAQARLKLYTYLENLGPRTLYCDTDSIVFTTKPGEWRPKLGDYLGDLTDEVPGNTITEFVTGGPKNYAYKLAVPEKAGNRTMCKVRGITLNYKNALDINFDTIKEMVTINRNDIRTVRDDYKIQRSNQKLLTVSQKKDYRIVFDKRVIMNDLTTRPYGY